MQRITTLILRFEEVSAAAMAPALALLVRGLQITPEKHPYSGEVQKVTSSLLQMPNVRHLSLLKPSDPLRNPPSRDFFETVFAWIGTHYTQIETLQLGIEHSSLNFLRTLHNLRALDFSGFSITPPSELSFIFPSMRSLSELTVSGPARGRTHTNEFRFLHQFVVQSLNADVLRKMRPLKKFSVQDLTAVECPELFSQTEDIFAALVSRHRSSLIELNIGSERAPDPDVGAALKSTIPTLGERKGMILDWPTGGPGRVTQISSLKTSK